MNPALATRTLRDYLPLGAGAAALLFAFVILFMFATHSIPLDEGRRWLELEWVRRLLNAMLGADLSKALTTTGLASFVFTHPFTWVLVVAFLFTMSSGVLSGEMDRGTMDTLATLPVSRAKIYMSVSVSVLLLGVPILWAAWAGVWLGAKLVGVHEPDMMSRLAVVVVNFHAAYFFIAGLSLAISASCERRTQALMWCFLIVFYSFILNLLAAFWPAAKSASFTGFLHYYMPLPIILSGEWPLRDMAVLLSAGTLIWFAGMIRFCRRDIHVT